MRQQITDQEQRFNSECSAQEDAFAWYIAQGKTNSDAYRASHEVSHWQANSIHVSACRLRQKSNVALRISDYQQTIGEGRLLTLEQDIAEFMRLREKSIAKGNLGAAVMAQVNISKLCGHQKEQVEVTHAVDLRAELAEVEKISPDLAREFAKQKGIPYH